MAGKCAVTMVMMMSLVCSLRDQTGVLSAPVEPESDDMMTTIQQRVLEHDSRLLVIERMYKESQGRLEDDIIETMDPRILALDGRLEAVLNTTNENSEVALMESVEDRTVSLEEIINTVISQLPREWPTGTYGLPRKNTGCPEPAGVTWRTGVRKHDTEDDNANNQWTHGLHFDGGFGRGDMSQKFCMKTISRDGSGSWPSGSYCIFKKSSCPSVVNMLKRWAKVSVAMPERGWDTLIRYCCRNDGSASSPISLPTGSPFYSSATDRAVRGVKVLRGAKARGEVASDLTPPGGRIAGGEIAVTPVATITITVDGMNVEEEFFRWMMKMTITKTAARGRIRTTTAEAGTIAFTTVTIRNSLAQQDNQTKMGQCCSCSRPRPARMPDVDGRHFRKYKFPFENLVLEGGGAKGMAYVGALKVLEDAGILRNIKRFGGTSAGSITAGFLAVGMSPQDILDKANENLKDILLSGRPCYLCAKCKYLWYFYNLKNKYGMFPATHFLDWYGKAIEEHLQKLKRRRQRSGEGNTDEFDGLNGDITFAEVYNAFGRELCTVSYETEFQTEVYSHVKTSPLLEIREAVRIVVCYGQDRYHLRRSSTRHVAERSGED
ncbi:hypothetical protein Bbelb_037600 [Branchiostoma belcheri]|nr:hypothetical protein Bbelb_037600 [Branchiostoma belcheri]